MLELERQPAVTEQPARNQPEQSER
jgi:hypothetical protein